MLSLAYTEGCSLFFTWQPPLTQRILRIQEDGFHHQNKTRRIVEVNDGEDEAIVIIVVEAKVIG